MTLRLLLPTGEFESFEVLEAVDRGPAEACAAVFEYALDAPDQARAIAKALLHRATGDDRHGLLADPDVVEALDLADVELGATWIEPLERLVQAINAGETINPFDTAALDEATRWRLAETARAAREAWVVSGRARPLDPSSVTPMIRMQPRARERRAATSSSRAGAASRSPGRSAGDDDPSPRPDRLGQLQRALARLLRRKGRT